MHLIRAALSLALLLISYVARAETLQAPVGGKSISLGDARDRLWSSRRRLDTRREWARDSSAHGRDGHSTRH